MRYAGTALTDYFSTPDFTGLGKTMLDSASMERNMATKADGFVADAGIQSAAKVASAGFQAEALEAQGQAQGQQSMASGIGNMISGIAGGFGSMGSGGGSSSYTPGSVVAANAGIGGSNKYNLDFNSGQYFGS